ncbi:MAG: hypothetical protein AAF614_27740 [Chloroflexota bacterium]
MKTLKTILAIGLLSWLLTAHSLPVGRVATCSPTLTFTTVPPVGSSADLVGETTCITPADYRVAIYIYVGGWWNKPTHGAPLTTINGDGSWTADIVTHPNDVNATQLVAFLVPASYSPPLISGTIFLPPSIRDSSVAETYVARDDASHLTFSGYTWNIKTSVGLAGPGPNYFSDDVWVDGNGRLHLNILQKDGNWHSTEVVHTGPFALGYGRYSFSLASAVDQLDPNIILGLFTWDFSASEHAYREIDIEIARWGNAADPTNAQYVIQPYTNSGNLSRFATGNSATSLHRFTWCPDRVIFDSFSGLIADPNNLIASWENSGDDVPSADDDREVSPRLNLWLMFGNAPTDGQAETVIVDSFDYEELVENLATMDDVMITDMGSNQVGLSWTAVSGAVAYELWEAASDFYFIPPATTCDQAANCTVVDATSTTTSHDGSTPESYLLRPVNHCGTPATEFANRTGVFHFDVVAGS